MIKLPLANFFNAIMPDNSLTLRIADLVIKFYCKQRKDAIFLRKNYADYLVDKNRSSKIPARIGISSGQPRVQPIGKDHFEIVLPSLVDQFLAFNDLFRNIFIHCLLRNNGLLLHASALADNGQGFVFAGPEGAGKSTIRKISPGTCLGDDSAIIRKIDNHYFLFGSPFYQKTRTIYPNQKLPLKAVLIIHPSQYDLIRELPQKTAAKKIIENAFLSGLGTKKEEMERLFFTSWSLVRQNLVFDLFFQKTSLFWDLLDMIKKKINSGLIKRVMKAINPGVTRRIPREIGWQPALTFASFLKDCLVIRDRTWSFEFNGERRVGKLAKMVSSLAGDHARLIRKMELKANRGDKSLIWFPVIEKDGHFTLLDGNHQAIAMARKGRVYDKQIIGLLIGQLPGRATCPWV